MADGDESRRPGKEPVFPDGGDGPDQDVMLNIEDFELGNIHITVQEAEGFEDDEILREEGFRRPSSSRSTGFEVNIQDSTGATVTKKLTLRDVHQLPSGERVVVDWDDITRQPRGKGGQLFNRYLTEQGGNFLQFDISAETWKRIQQSLKNSVWEKVKGKFVVRDANREFAISKMGEGWKNRRNRLYHQKEGDGTRTMQELEADVPDGVDAADWTRFVRFRRSPEQQAVARRAVRSRSRQTIHHTAGSKPFSVTYSELDEAARREGRRATYGEMFVTTHRHSDGSPLTQETEEIISHIQRTDAELRESQGSAVDPTASLRVAMQGRDGHPGRLPGFGFRATKSLVYGGRTYEAGTSSSAAASQDTASGPRRHSAPTDVDRDVQELLQQQKREMKEQMQQERQEMQQQMQQQMEMWRQTANVMLQMAFQTAFPGAAPPELPPMPPMAPPPVPPPSHPPQADDPQPPSPPADI